MAALAWLRDTTAEARSLIFLLRRAVLRGGHDPHALRRALELSLTPLQLDDRARALGFCHEDLRRARLALVAVADELTQRPGSRCDYSNPPPPGELPLLQQRHFGNTTSAGQFFFDELQTMLANPRPGPADLAVLELFALCLAVGLRGKYEDRDLTGHETTRARVLDRLRATLALPDAPVPLPPAPWPAPAVRGRRLAVLAALAVLFAAALLLTLRAALSADVATLLDRLSTLQSAAP